VEFHDDGCADPLTSRATRVANICQCGNGYSVRMPIPSLKPQLQRRFNFSPSGASRSGEDRQRVADICIYMHISTYNLSIAFGFTTP
jgi:hypothetical protein